MENENVKEVNDAFAIDEKPTKAKGNRTYLPITPLVVIFSFVAILLLFLSQIFAMVSNSVVPGLVVLSCGLASLITALVFYSIELVQNKTIAINPQLFCIVLSIITFVLALF